MTEYNKLRKRTLDDVVICVGIFILDAMLFMGVGNILGPVSMAIICFFAGLGTGYFTIRLYRDIRHMICLCKDVWHFEK